MFLTHPVEIFKIRLKIKIIKLNTTLTTRIIDSTITNNSLNIFINRISTAIINTKRIKDTANHMIIIKAMKMKKRDIKIRSMETTLSRESIMMILTIMITRYNPIHNNKNRWRSPVRQNLKKNEEKETKTGDNQVFNNLSKKKNSKYNSSRFKLFNL